MNKRKMSVLIYSNPPWSQSGYGKQTRYMCSGLLSRGYVVGMQPNYGMGMGTIRNFDGYRVHPQGHDLSMPETIEACRKYKYDVLITLYDHFVMGELAGLVRKYRVPWVPYPPMDFTVINRQLADIFNAATYIVPMSKYGKELLTKAGFDNVYNPIYHGVDCDIYKPLIGEYTKEHMRKEWLGFKDKSFVISIMKMNKGMRVKIPEMLEAVKIFINNNPDLKNEVGVYIHSIPSVANGTDLTVVKEMLGIENLVRFAEPYHYTEGYSEYEMSQIYNSSDVMLNCTSSGGFEVPIIESMACGTPVIATDAEVMHELLEPVTPELLSPPKCDYWTELPSKQYQPDPYDIADKIQTAMNADPQRYAEILPKYVREIFEFDILIPQWDTFLQFFRSYVDEQCMTIPTTTSRYLRRLRNQIVEVAAK